MAYTFQHNSVDRSGHGQQINIIQRKDVDAEHGILDAILLETVDILFLLYNDRRLIISISSIGTIRGSKSLN